MKLSEPVDTGRLRLRSLTLEDSELMLAVWNDPAFVRFVGDRGIRTSEEARDAMQKGALHLYEEFGYGPYRVSLLDCDTAIGICGLFRRANDLASGNTIASQANPHYGNSRQISPHHFSVRSA